MNINRITGDMLAASLKQLGAENITEINSMLYHISFHLNNRIKVTYVYNINAKNQYFLQRISPYPLGKGLFVNQNEIIDFIKRDISKFKNAAQSSNFNLFINVTSTLSHMANDIESLFLNYNISNQTLDDLYHQLMNLELSISRAKSRSTHILLHEEQE